jgi:cytochrome P450
MTVDATASGTATQRRPEPVKDEGSVADSPASVDAVPPGSFGLPVIGETLSFLRDTPGFLDDRFRRHGPIFKTRLLNEPVVCLGGHEAFTLFMDERYFTRVGGSPPQVRELLNPDALPFIDGDYHRKRKSLILQGFDRPSLDSYLPTLERLFARYIAGWEQKRTFAWVPELASLGFAVVDCVFSGADPGVDNRVVFEQFQRATAAMLAIPIKLPFSTFGRALAARDKLREYTGGVVAARRRSPRSDLVSRLMNVNDGAGGLTDRELRIELLHFYFAGLPLYSALTYHLMLLAQNPAVWERAQSEVLANAPSGPITMDVLDKLPYVHQTCLESRRYAAVVALTFFATVRESFVFHGYHVPQGWKAIGLIASTMHDAGTFTSPSTYDPARFAPPRSEDRRFPNAYVAQGGGPETGHRCAGEKFTHVVMGALTAHLLRDFTWDLPSQNLRPRLGKIAPTPFDDLQVVFRRRSRANGGGPAGRTPEGSGRHSTGRA